VQARHSAAMVCAIKLAHPFAGESIKSRSAIKHYGLCMVAIRARLLSLFNSLWQRRDYEAMKPAADRIRQRRGLIGLRSAEIESRRVS